MNYAYLELFGHNNLGICAVEEVQRFGATFCEARPLGKDGKPGEPQLIAGNAIYRAQPVDEARALRMATEGLWSIPRLEAHHDEGVVDAEFGPVDGAQARGEQDSAEGKEPLSDQEITALFEGDGVIAAYRSGYGPTLDDQIAQARKEIDDLTEERNEARGERGYDHLDEQRNNALQALDELLCQKMDVLGEKDAAAGLPKRENVAADFGWNYELAAEFPGFYSAAYERVKQG